jgi:MFS family permease
MGALHTDESGVTWTLTAYLVSAAVFTPLVGRLGDIYGKRRLLVIALGAASPLPQPAYSREEF